jgi:hypothetical protein
MYPSIVVFDDHNGDFRRGTLLVKRPEAGTMHRDSYYESKHISINTIIPRLQLLTCIEASTLANEIDVEFWTARAASDQS